MTARWVQTVPASDVTSSPDASGLSTDCAFAEVQVELVPMIPRKPGRWEVYLLPGMRVVIRKGGIARLALLTANLAAGSFGRRAGNLQTNGRLFDIQKDYFEESPITDSSVEHRTARGKLQSTLDQMDKVTPPKFNKFESDGRKPY